MQAKWRSLVAAAGGFPPPYYHSLFPAAVAPDCCSTRALFASHKAGLFIPAYTQAVHSTGGFCINLVCPRATRCHPVCASSSIIPNAVKDAGKGDVQNVMHPASALSCSLTHSPACPPANQPPPHCNPLDVQLNQFSPQWLSNFHFRGGQK